MHEDGVWQYMLDTSRTQALAAEQTVVEQFGYGATDGRLTTAGRLNLIIQGTNDAPVVTGSVTAQAAELGKAFTTILSAQGTLFRDIDIGDSLSYALTLDSGQPLPSWLQFDAQTSQLSGTPTGSATAYTLRLTATDRAGAQASLSFGLTVKAAANGVIQGTTGNDVLVGTTGNDILDGLAGSDQMSGGNGDDIYYVDTLPSASGTTPGNEGVGNGADAPPPGHTVNQNDVPGTSPGNPGNGQGNGNGSAYSNGNSTASPSVTGDLVVELANQGYDIVRSTVSYTLADNVEALELLGSAALNGTGNALANRLQGNSGNNTLTGLAGNDTYVFEKGWDRDIVVDKDSAAGNQDIIQFGVGIGVDQLWFSKKGNDLRVDLSKASPEPIECGGLWTNY